MGGKNDTYEYLFNFLIHTILPITLVFSCSFDQAGLINDLQYTSCSISCIL